MQWRISLLQSKQDKSFKF